MNKHNLKLLSLVTLSFTCINLQGKLNFETESEKHEEKNKGKSYWSDEDDIQWKLNHNVPVDADELNLSFLNAADAGDIDLVKVLLKHGADINSRSVYVGNASALELAAWRCNYNLARFLLKNGANPNLPSDYWPTNPLIISIENLLRRENPTFNPDPDSTWMEQMQHHKEFLEYTKKCNYFDMIKLLLAHGASIYDVKHGESALSIIEQLKQDKHLTPVEKELIQLIEMHKKIK